MASLAENFRAFLLADPAIEAMVSGRVYEKHVPESSRWPYIWFRRSGTENEDTTDATPGTPAFRHSFDVEIVSDDPDEAEALADLVKAHHLHYGIFGEQTIKGLFVDDHSDDYERRNDMSDAGWHVPAVTVQVVP